MSGTLAALYFSFLAGNFNMFLFNPLSRMLCHMPVEHTSLISSITVFGVIVGEVLIGHSGDSKLGLIGALRLSLALIILGSLFCAISSNVYYMCFCRLIVGIGIGGTYPLVAALASATPPTPKTATSSSNPLLGSSSGSMNGKDPTNSFPSIMPPPTAPTPPPAPPSSSTTTLRTLTAFSSQGTAIIVTNIAAAVCATYVSATHAWRGVLVLGGVAGLLAAVLVEINFGNLNICGMGQAPVDMARPERDVEAADASTAKSRLLGSVGAPEPSGAHQPSPVLATTKPLTTSAFALPGPSTKGRCVAGNYVAGSAVSGPGSAGQQVMSITVTPLSAAGNGDVPSPPATAATQHGQYSTYATTSGPLATSPQVAGEGKQLSLTQLLADALRPDAPAHARTTLIRVLGCGGVWCLFDVMFYANQFFSSLILQMIVVGPTSHTPASHAPHAGLGGDGGSGSIGPAGSTKAAGGDRDRGGWVASLADLFSFGARTTTAASGGLHGGIVDAYGGAAASDADVIAASKLGAAGGTTSRARLASIPFVATPPHVGALGGAASATTVASSAAAIALGSVSSAATAGAIGSAGGALAAAGAAAVPALAGGDAAAGAVGSLASAAARALASPGAASATAAAVVAAAATVVARVNATAGGAKFVAGGVSGALASLSALSKGALGGVTVGSAGAGEAVAPPTVAVAGDGGAADVAATRRVAVEASLASNIKESKIASGLLGGSYSADCDMDAVVSVVSTKLYVDTLPLCGFAAAFAILIFFPNVSLLTMQNAGLIGMSIVYFILAEVIESAGFAVSSSHPPAHTAPVAPGSGNGGGPAPPGAPHGPSMNAGLLFGILYALSFLLANVGPNTTTYILPTRIFPPSIRSSAHGVCAALGKIGALGGGALVGPIISAKGVSAAFYMCGAIGIVTLIISVWLLRKSVDGGVGCLPPDERWDQSNANVDNVVVETPRDQPVGRGPFVRERAV